MVVATDQMFLVSGNGKTLPMLVIERLVIEAAVRRHEGNVSSAARALGMGRSTVYRRFESWGVDPRDLA